MRTGSSLLVISSSSSIYQKISLVSDHAAQKVSAIQNQGTSALKNVVAAKDTTLSAASAALEASAEADHHNAAAAWAPPAKVVHVSQWG